MKLKILFLYLVTILLLPSPLIAQHHHGRGDKTILSGRIITTENGKEDIVDFATVYLKGTTFGSSTDQQGLYHIKAPAGNYTLVVSAIGYRTVEKKVSLKRGERTKLNVTLTPETHVLDEVTVVSTGVSRVKRSAYNAVAVDTKELQNTTKNLG